MKREFKMKKRIAMLLTCIMVGTMLVGCGKSSGAGAGAALGSYGAVSLKAAEQGARIQNGTVQELTLYDNDTYMLTVSGTTWRSPDYEGGAAFESYFQTNLTVFGTYEVTASSEGDEATNPTKSIELGDITRCIFGTTANDNLQTGGLESYDYLGDSDKLDDATKTAALAYFNVISKTVVVDEVAFAMDAAIDIPAY